MMTRFSTPARSDCAADSYSAVLYLSFGGPEKADEVLPFLRKVTAGRDIPDERLAAVAEHYYHCGGASPINQQNRAIIERLAQRLQEDGYDLPIYFGNRNWHPFVEDTVQRLYADGHRRVLVFVTSAWGGYSGSRQYDEDLQRALASLPAEHREDKLVLQRLPQYNKHPLLIESFAAGVKKSMAKLAAAGLSEEQIIVIFTAHSIPLQADKESGPPGELYSQQVHRLAAAVSHNIGLNKYVVAWQSRSGPPQVPWLAPDVNAIITEVAASYRGVVVCPIGFISDHMEVLWDLDNEARETAEEQGILFERAPTVAEDSRFIDMIVDLIFQEISTSSTQ